MPSFAPGSVPFEGPNSAKLLSLGLPVGRRPRAWGAWKSSGTFDPVFGSGFP